ncbi:hypothetical protein AAWM_07985 [Aspergillus awamori]|uniref:Uncharacterized protein n=2 Tax=Aspergillus TaxID=5052 RepID=A0A3F3Q5K5_9EURO|nr:hypothetical protein BDQ94DRAFT_19668 [Aspergillus welwitschiae]RDH34451.1 hypothetical protein BDQ94DRAFT_19668 [Aspergillus welwitschiae]GCB25100.1 hypothetical protein AAWM_07985 [Aspergillus awamori]GKZ62149.1 hypothetical protein AnigIFM49718_009226 [Aspergillus niger]GLA39674.1 hypothetical protein AnigIFM63309_007273 [Aspergillus niger]
MWGKMSFHRSRKPVIGKPTLIDKTLDDSVYRSLSPAPGNQSSDTLAHPKSRPAIARNPTDSLLPAQRPDTGRRVASTSHALDIATGDQPHQRSASLSHNYLLDPATFTHDLYRPESASISPPDSPISFGRPPASRDSSRVSPIEDDFRIDSSAGSMENKENTRFASHLPVLRKRTNSQADRLQTPKSSRSQTSRWDDFSGELTPSDLSMSGPTTPGSVSFRTEISAKPASSHSSNIFGWSKDHLNSKRKLSDPRTRVSKTENSLPPGVREPWKGPSGRAPIIAPIQERPRAKSPSRVHMSRSNDRLREAHSTTPDYAACGFVPTVVTTITAGDSKPKASEKVRHTTSRDNLRTRTPEEPAPISIVSSAEPPRVDFPAPDDWESSLADLKLTTDDAAEQPASRFSATTYEPTETASSVGSAHGSIDAASQSTEHVPSIMSRKRPVPSAVAPAKKPSRKPTPAQAPEAEPPKDQLQLTPEEQIQNRIQTLEARRDTLTRRRTNIDTIIYELTQVIQPSSVAYDMAARDEVKRTVASLESELAEIKREEHEIGLKLFRAWKKRDDLGFGGGSLWVKRVTS